MTHSRSQGTQLAKLQELVRYWGTDYDWRKVESKPNALPQFNRMRSIEPRKCGRGAPIATLSIFNEVDEGSHFAAWEQPQLLAAELRARSDRFADSLRT